MSFDRAWSNYIPMLNSYARVLCFRSGQFIDTEDLVQETALNCWKAWPNRYGDLKPWIMVMMRNTHARMMRDMWGRNGVRQLDEWKAGEDHRFCDGSQFDAAYLHQLRDMMDNLGPAQRDALIGIYSGHTAKEIAESSKKSLPSVTMALSLGRRRLKEVEHE